MLDAQQRWLLLINIVFNLVMGFILPVNTIFITKNLHESMVVAGFVLMLYSGFMMLGNFLGGRLFDRFSQRKTLVGGFTLAAIGFLLIAKFHTWPVYAGLLLMVGLGMGIAYTAVNSYTAIAAQQHPQQYQQIFNRMYLSANVGIALGSMGVSSIFQASIFWTFFLPALCFFVCLLIVLTHGAVLDGAAVSNVYQANSTVASPNKKKSLQLSRQRLRINLVLICITVLIVWLGYSQWDSNLSLYMLDQGLTMHDYSLLFSINAASLIIVQPLMNRFICRWLPLLKSQIALGLGIMGSSFILLPGARNYGQYILSMLILTIGESITFPTIPALLSKFAPQGRQGTYQSFYVVFGSLGRALGPYLGSLIATEISFAWLFGLIFGSVILVGLGMLAVKEVNYS